MSYKLSSKSSQPLVTVVGGGYWGVNVIRNFHQLGALHSIVEPSESVARHLQKTFDVPILTLDEALSEDSVRGVAVCTPAPTHFNVAMQALSFDKDVFVEKPLALTTDDSEALVRESDKRNKVLMVGHLLHYHPAFLKVLEYVRAGVLGDVVSVSSVRRSLGKVRSDENALWSLAPHDISMILAIFGEQPREIFANGAAYLREGIHDSVSVNMKFSRGGIANVDVSWLWPVKEQRLVVTGSKGMMVFDDTLPLKQKVAFFAHEVEVVGGETRIKKADPLMITIDDIEPLHAECSHFIDTIFSRVTCRTGGAEGKNVVDVLARAQTELKPNS